MRRRRAGLLLLFLLPTLAAAADPPWIARSRLGMVASDHADASRIGADILAAGGNAFDAAVATSFALAVTRPDSTGLGGGGFMVAYVAKERRFVTLDFRERAPMAATAELYAKVRTDAGDGPSPTVYGPHAVGVPGQVAGLAEIHVRFGTLWWPRLVFPAAELAREGFVLDEHHCAACRSTLADFEKWPALKERYGLLYKLHLGSGTPPQPGDHLRLPNLAEALQAIADRGAECFYEGPLGKMITYHLREAGGVLTMQDIASYRVKEREPVRVRYGDYEIVSMPPPSSGGLCLAETLNILSAARDRSDLHHATYGGHVLVEALKHAFADRARWLGDPDFGAIPTDRLLSMDYALELARRIKPEQVLQRDAYGSVAPPPDDAGTSHFCVVDRAGNVVALTETINGSFGSLIVVEPFDFVLNNQMDDFTAEPGKPNLYGLVQGAANAIAPSKRPLSSMSPTIVLKDGRPVLVLGGSGGPRIITSVLQVLLNVIERDMPLEQAIEAPRLHHQWLPDEVRFDRDPPAELVDGLKKAGQTIGDRPAVGIVQAIQILDDGTLIGASDPRKGGRPAGVEKITDQKKITTENTEGDEGSRD